MKKIAFLIVSIIGLLMACSNQSSQNEKNTVQQAEEESIQADISTVSNESEQYTYYKEDLFKTDYIDFSLESIGDNRITFLVKNKSGIPLKLNIALSVDGVMTNVNGDDLSVNINETSGYQRITCQANINGKSHQKLSLAIEVCHDNRVYETKTTCDFPLEGELNPITLEEGTVLNETEEYVLYWVKSKNNYLKFKIENKTDDYVLMAADNIHIDDTDYTGCCTSRLTGHSVGYLYIESPTPIFKSGTYETIQCRITPYIDGYYPNAYFYNFSVKADSENPNNLEALCQICDINDTLQKDQTESQQEPEDFENVLDNNLLNYASYLGKTKTEIGLSDDNKVDDHYYYLGKAHFLGVERNVYINIGDDDTAWHLRVGDEGDYPSLDTLKKQLDEVCGEPDFNSELSCIYRNSNLHLEIYVDGMYSFLIDDQNKMQFNTMVLINPYNSEQ